MVIDQSVVDLAADPIGRLTETVVGTDRLLADEGHRLVGTRLCWADQRQAGQLRKALDDSGVQNVSLLSEPEAVTALVRNISRGTGQHGVLLIDDDTAMLSVVGGDDATMTALAAEPLRGADSVTAAGRLLARLREQPGRPKTST
ncbi:putative conserved membrane protein [Mycobacterium xenopi 3993]|nr:putative conserved membrane protein [Mycobacterium xenopi 3993]